MAAQRVGYVRGITLDQNEQHQLDGQVLGRVLTGEDSPAWKACGRLVQ